MTLAQLGGICLFLGAVFGAAGIVALVALFRDPRDRSDD